MTLSGSTSREWTAEAVQIMMRFAERTGLNLTKHRYLWTDAFAVTNFLGLAHGTGEACHAELALRLLDRVHHTLGRHRSDDSRSGWISGLPESDGEAHPAIGGLRIGKELPERSPNELLDSELEWDRDGQYFHYLTRWIHALNQTALSTGNAIFITWARELAKTAHDRFVYSPPGGNSKRMYWKMSIDLSRPLVSSMGQHDALDGYVACVEIEATAARLPTAGGPKVVADANDFASMIDRRGLATPDPLGIGALLADAYRLDQLAGKGATVEDALVDDLLTAGLLGIDVYLRQGGLRESVARRLAFREAGLAIGLEAAALMREEASSSAERGQRQHDSTKRRSLLEALGHYDHLVNDIVTFWLDRLQRGLMTNEHRDINEVMLATSLAPAGYLTNRLSQLVA
jgi:hypothetical protein